MVDQMEMHAEVCGNGNSSAMASAAGVQQSDEANSHSSNESGSGDVSEKKSPIFKCGKTVIASARTMLFRVWNYFTLEKVKQEHVMDLDLVYQRTALATGIPTDAIQQIVMDVDTS